VIRLHDRDFAHERVAEEVDLVVDHVAVVCVARELVGLDLGGRGEGAVGAGIGAGGDQRSGHRAHDGGAEKVFPQHA
jgi:hypothetical protein